MAEQEPDDPFQAHSANPVGRIGRMLDYVFPLFDVEERGGETKVNGYLGTGFFIGRRGFAITATHVLLSATKTIMAAFPDESGPGWKAYAVTAWELHSQEDVAIIAVAPPADQPNWRSVVCLAGVRATAASPYHLWGYPQDAAYELVDGDLSQQLRPDLVYSEGHVRRRVTDVPLPAIRGSRFIELSAVAGGGCSGSPVMDRRPGHRRGLLGVYVGERTNDRATSVGYAARIEELHDWMPELLGHVLSAELADVD